MKRNVIVALDFPNGKEALQFVDKFEEIDESLYFKIGMELFYSEGLEIVNEIKAHGYKVFLDLKLHDIPNTVKSSMKVLAKAGVDMINVHASGGIRMMSAALEGLQEGAKENENTERPKLIAVTQLTSTDKEMMNNELLIAGDVQDVVVQYAKNSKKAGLDGVVCSALEAPKIHQEVGDDFLTVTPGIRLQGDAVGDQKRVTTPKKAEELGVDYMVIGRSITRAINPILAYKKCTEGV